MLRKGFCYILIIGFIAAQSGKLVTYLSFKANQDYIVQVMCVNRDNPELNCQGVCYLNDMLDTQHKKEVIQKTQKKSEILFFSKNLIRKINFSWVKGTSLLFAKQIATVQQILPYDFIHEVFHPPK